MIRPAEQSSRYNQKKGPAKRQGLSILSSIVVRLARDYVGCAWAFLALSDLEINLLAFIERCVAGCLDFRVMDKQIVAAVIRANKAKSLT